MKDQSTTNQQPVLSVENVQNPSTQVRIPVDTMLENEIWQYRYPPFDNLFAQKGNDDADEEAAFSGRLSSDTLPSYVIGILDPAELVDGLFQQRPFGLNRNQPNFKRNSVSSFSDDQFIREGKNLPNQGRKIFGVIKQCQCRSCTLHQVNCVTLSLPAYMFTASRYVTTS